MFNQQSSQNRFIHKFLSCFIIFAFFTQTILPARLSFAQALPQTVLNLPVPGTLVLPTLNFQPVLMKGLNLTPTDPLDIKFMFDQGQNELSQEELKQEADKVIRYFIAALAVPKESLWVNLSPYERNRIAPEVLGQTEMGRDLLAQDYLLKQLTASLMNPEDALGQKFWTRVYAKAQEQFGTTEVPVNTFNKIWIVPEEAKVYEHRGGVFLVENHLKVMLEEDYLALDANRGRTNHGLGDITEKDMDITSGVSSEIVREILIPEIEREVNEGKLFANLRQIYTAMLLATWYKDSLKAESFGKGFFDQGKIKGVEVDDKEIIQKIYDQYVESFQKGVFDYVKDEYDAASQEIVPRKYFSGGVGLQNAKVSSNVKKKNIDTAILGIAVPFIVAGAFSGTASGQDSIKIGMDSTLKAGTEELKEIQAQVNDSTKTSVDSSSVKVYGTAILDEKGDKAARISEKNGKYSIGIFTYDLQKALTKNYEILVTEIPVKLNGEELTNKIMEENGISFGDNARNSELEKGAYILQNDSNSNATHAYKIDLGTGELVKISLEEFDKEIALSENEIKEFSTRKNIYSTENLGKVKTLYQQVNINADGSEVNSHLLYRFPKYHNFMVDPNVVMGSLSESFESNVQIYMGMGLKMALESGPWIVGADGKVISTFDLGQNNEEREKMRHKVLSLSSGYNIFKGKGLKYFLNNGITFGQKNLENYWQTYVGLYGERWGDENDNGFTNMDINVYMGGKEGVVGFDSVSVSAGEIDYLGNGYLEIGLKGSIKKDGKGEFDGVGQFNLDYRNLWGGVGIGGLIVSAEGPLSYTALINSMVNVAWTKKALGLEGTVSVQLGYNFIEREPTGQVTVNLFGFGEEKQHGRTRYVSQVEAGFDFNKSDIGVSRNEKYRNRFFNAGDIGDDFIKNMIEKKIFTQQFESFDKKKHFENLIEGRKEKVNELRILRKQLDEFLKKSKEKKKGMGQGILGLTPTTYDALAAADLLDTLKYDVRKRSQLSELQSKIWEKDFEAMQAEAAMENVYDNIVKYSPMVNKKLTQLKQQTRLEPLSEYLKNKLADSRKAINAKGKSDKAMLNNPGGIDLNPEIGTITVDSEHKFEWNIDPNYRPFENIPMDGLMHQIIIINPVPIQTIPLMFGLSDDKSQETEKSASETPKDDYISLGEVALVNKK